MSLKQMPQRSVAVPSGARLVTRVEMARRITDEVVEVSPRTLENWPLPYRLVCGRAMYDVAEGLAHARKLVETAPLYRGGRRRSSV